MSSDQRFPVATFGGFGPWGQRHKLDLTAFADLLLERQVVSSKSHARGFSPTAYLDDYTHVRDDGERIEVHAPKLYRSNDGVDLVSALVGDLDHGEPNRADLAALGVHVLGYTTWSHRQYAPRWRLVFPLAHPVPAARWPAFYRGGVALLEPRCDANLNDPAHFFFGHSCPSAGREHAETFLYGGRLLDPDDVPVVAGSPSTPLIAEPVRTPTSHERYRAERVLDVCVDRLAKRARDSRQTYAYGLARLLGHWIASRCLDLDDVAAALWRACECNEVALERPAEIRRAIDRGLRKGIADGAIDFDHEPPRSRPVRDAQPPRTVPV
jgi:hypothetical protein